MKRFLKICKQREERHEDVKQAYRMWNDLLDRIYSAGMWPDDLGDENTVVRLSQGKVCEVKLIDVGLMMDFTEKFVVDNRKVAKRGFRRF
jgi:hypothetical protein